MSGPAKCALRPRPNLRGCLLRKVHSYMHGSPILCLVCLLGKNRLTSARRPPAHRQKKPPVSLEMKALNGAVRRFKSDQVDVVGLEELRRIACPGMPYFDFLALVLGAGLEVREGKPRMVVL